MTDDLDPEQAATMLMQQHGDNAAHYAAQWATALLEAGNHEEARRFAQISRAIRMMLHVLPEGRTPAVRPSARRRRTK
jgi:hypothetical protein